MSCAAFCCKATFDGAAHSYDASASMQLVIARKLCSMLPKQRIRVLDIGCGSGYIGRLLPITKAIVQLDIAENMCRHAKQNNATTTINGDMNALPFAGSTFDTVISSMALQWSPDLNKSVAEMQRVLRAGGNFFVALPVKGTFQELEVVRQRLGQNPRNFFLHFEEIKKIFANNLLNYQTIQYTQHHHTFRDFMASLKATGVQASDAEPLNLFQAGRLYHQLYTTTKGISVTWHIIYISGHFNNF